MEGRFLFLEKQYRVVSHSLEFKRLISRNFQLTLTKKTVVYYS